MFWVLHILAILFGFVFLFVTVPLHLIYISVNKKRKD